MEKALKQLGFIWQFYQDRILPKYYPGDEVAVLYALGIVYGLVALLLMPLPCLSRKRRKPFRKYLIQMNSLGGLAVAAYALYIESSLEKNPFYVPGCNAFGGSCSKVLTSSYSHILSHWEILPKGHVLDLSLAQAGIFLYTTYFLAISIPFRWFMREELFLTVAIAGALFSCYLLYVIKFVLSDFCIVCTSFHICNFMMLFLAFLEYRKPQGRYLSFRSKRKTS
mmetsp:Transcript_11083/g.12688  ORF Transcript_11083/g.12688 Transcript_11083/m.12688 type:complete len:224 (+) Transcript_11083:153-824(+)